MRPLQGSLPSASLPQSCIIHIMKYCYVNSTVINESPMVAVRSDALSADDCAYLIKAAQGHLKRARVSLDRGGAELPGRSGSNAWLRYQDDARVRHIGQTIADWIGIPLANAEAIQVIHYGPEQKYGAHFDAYDLHTDKGQRCCAKGGQRLITCLIYLNDVPAGGSTSFPKLGLTVQAEKGKMLIFHNVDREDYSKPHPLSLHGGDPVLEGEKWACNIWFHERAMNAAADTLLPREPAKAPLRKSAVVSNRSGALFEQVAAQLAPKLQQQAHPTLLLYWDTFGNEPDYDTRGYGRVVRLIDRRLLNAVSNKRKLGEAITAARLLHIAPATFTRVDDARASGLTPKLWFVKNPFATGGQGMSCVTHEALATLELPQHAILQAGVENLHTLNGKKYTIRSYVLVWKQLYFVYPNGITILHAPDYDEHSPDPHVQINHAGYLNPESGVKMKSLRDIGLAEDVTRRAQQTMTALQPVLANLIQASSEDAYVILGIDFLRQQDGALQLIEINAFPNFTHTPHINQTVNIPMLTAALGMMLEGTAPSVSAPTADAATAAAGPPLPSA
jgi:hypothetical protein